MSTGVRVQVPPSAQEILSGGLDRVRATGDRVHLRFADDLRRAHRDLTLSGLIALMPGEIDGEVTSDVDAEPLGHRRPRETGESGSPSIWVTRPSRT